MQIIFIPKGISEELMNYHLDQIESDELEEIKMDLEEGKLVYSITKEYNFKNDTLHGYYLEYKTKSDDTLIYGHFFEGKKDGEWKYWATDRNEIEKVEVYKNDKLIK